MRVFILDDQQARHNTFRQRYKGHDLTLVRTYKDACRILRSAARFDVVSLDHDIADEEPANMEYTGRKRTGLDVAHFIADALAGNNRKPGRVIVHTHNVGKAPVMLDVLEQSGIRTEYNPF